MSMHSTSLLGSKSLLEKPPGEDRDLVTQEANAIHSRGRKATATYFYTQIERAEGSSQRRKAAHATPAVRRQRCELGKGGSTT